MPCPIVYGAVVDSACLVWETACGKQGACWLYDAGIFRMFYHGKRGARWSQAEPGPSVEGEPWADL